MEHVDTEKASVRVDFLNAQSSHERLEEFVFTDEIVKEWFDIGLKLAESMKSPDGVNMLLDWKVPIDIVKMGLVQGTRNTANSDAQAARMMKMSANTIRTSISAIAKLGFGHAKP